MNPPARARLKKAMEATSASYVAVSADDVIAACEDVPVDEVTGRLNSAAQKALLGRLPPRRGEPAPREINLHRKDLQHLLAGLDEADARQQAAQVYPPDTPASEPPATETADEPQAEPEPEPEPEEEAEKDRA